MSIDWHTNEERVRRGDWPSIQLTSILGLIDSGTLDHKTHIPFSHGGARALFDKTGSKLTVEIEPLELAESHDLYALSDQACVPLIQSEPGSKLELTEVDPRLVDPGERPRVHLLLVPK